MKNHPPRVRGSGGRPLLAAAQERRISDFGNGGGLGIGWPWRCPQERRICGFGNGGERGIRGGCGNNG